MRASSTESRPFEDEPRLLISLKRDIHAPSLARAAVDGFLEDTHATSACQETVRLLVSELVSNAVIHAHAPADSQIVLCAHLLERGGVHVEVIDQGAGFTPVARDPAEPPGGSYGLYLVAKQTARWGVDRDGGTRVWFDQIS